MIQISYQGKTYSLLPDETVLDGLLRQGVAIPHACRGGVCLSCMMRADRGSVPAQAQRGLKDTQREQGYFLACQCRPEENISICKTGSTVTVTITAKDRLNEQVARVCLRSETSFDYRAGQFAHLRRDDGLSRPYSLASVPGLDRWMELHVRLVPNGMMSQWLFHRASVGDRLQLHGPSGNCFYLSENNEQPLLLAGTGTGLAPLYGIVRDALKQGHRGEVRLFHGVVRRCELYLIDELRRLASRYENFSYTPCVLQGEPVEDGASGNLIDHVLRTADKFTGWKIYLCGNPDLVAELRKQVFLKGASMREIYADAFFPTAVEASAK